MSAAYQHARVNRFRAEGVPESALHGRLSTYVNYACRCDLCRAANRDWQREATVRRAAALTADPSLVPHGLASTYGNYRCRCEPCRIANRRQKKASA